MKFSSEAKLGLIGIVTLAVVIWGINYLKGRNILSNSYSLSAFYSDAGGLESSAPVLLNGIKIGYVKELELIPENRLPVKVILSVEKTYSIQQGSYAVLISADLMGSKAIKIEPSDQEQFHKQDDVIQSRVELDMLSSIQTQLMPVAKQIGAVVVSLDTLVAGLDKMVGSESTFDILEDFSAISESLKNQLKQGGSLDQSFRNLESFTGMLKTQEDELASLTGHLNSISESVDSAGIKGLTHELKAVSHQFNILLTQINSGDGSAGKFIREDSLYLNLDQLILDLDTLIKDLNENPENYVQISLFGNSQKKK